MAIVQLCCPHVCCPIEVCCRRLSCWYLCWYWFNSSLTPSIAVMMFTCCCCPPMVLLSPCYGLFPSSHSDVFYLLALHLIQAHSDSNSTILPIGMSRMPLVTSYAIYSLPMIHQLAMAYRACGIELVMECTGVHLTRASLAPYLDSAGCGAKKVRTCRVFF
jgi:hypothetical protein